MNQKKMLKNRIKSALVGLASLAIILNFVNLHSGDSQPFLSVSVADALSLKSKIDISLDMHALMQSPSYFLKPLADILQERYVMANLTQDFSLLNVNILIDSFGGSVAVMYAIEGYMKRAQNKGNFFYTCYVTNAISAAFYLMVRLCNKTILVKGAKVAQHPAHIGREMSTVDTLIISKEMSDKEADSLSLDRDMWFSLTRRVGKLKYFSVKELLEYGIVQELYERK